MWPGRASGSYSTSIARRVTLIIHPVITGLNVISIEQSVYLQPYFFLPLYCLSVDFDLRLPIISLVSLNFSYRSFV
jgi:hypothetical protein